MTMQTSPLSSTTSWQSSLKWIAVGATVLVSGFVWQYAYSFGGAEPGIAIPPPVQDEAAAQKAATKTETAIFAGGCFWGVQGVFQHVQGVQRVVSGYAGGAANTARYETVGTGRTGHAESVEITYDPAKVSYGTLLQIFFSVAHNPTERNRQGPDVGTQYRSAVFPVNASQQHIAQAYIAQLDAAKSFRQPIVTRIENYTGFYPAEDYHQDFLTRHPAHPYIVVNDLPKVNELKRLFPQRYMDTPVLVNTAS